MLKIVNYIIMGFINLYGLYFFINGIFYFKKRKEMIIRSDKINHFTILIPARNEEKVIENLIDSLKKQKYDKRKYKIIVVINNSTDNTEKVVEKNKVDIIKCKNDISSKGDALKEAFTLLKDSNTDAYIIFDADNLVDKNFLLEMNKSINKGYKVAEGLRDIKYVKNNWLSSSYGIYYYIENLFFNEARTNIGKSAVISGTGFMVKKEVLDDYGYNVKTLTEDVEFSTHCILNNIKIDYVKKAIFYDEHPTKLMVSYKQRKRWSKGDLECMKYYSKDLYWNFFKTKNTSSFDMTLVYLAPIVQILSIVSMILSFVVSENILRTFMMVGILGNIALYIVQVILCLFVVISHKKSVEDFLSGILLFPVFIFTWLPINFIVMFKKDIKWEHIEHKESIAIEKI